MLVVSVEKHSPVYAVSVYVPATVAVNTTVNESELKPPGPVHTYDVPPGAAAVRVTVVPGQTTVGTLIAEIVGGAGYTVTV